MSMSLRVKLILMLALLICGWMPMSASAVELVSAAFYKKADGSCVTGMEIDKVDVALTQSKDGRYVLNTNGRACVLALAFAVTREAEESEVQVQWIFPKGSYCKDDAPLVLYVGKEAGSLPWNTRACRTMRFNTKLDAQCLGTLKVKITDSEGKSLGKYEVEVR